MKIFILGRFGNLAGWLEDATAAWRGDGHSVQTGNFRHPWLSRALAKALQEPMAEAIVRRIRAFAPDLILAIGGHVPGPVLQRIAGLPGRAPLGAWVGDVFGPEAPWAGAPYDLAAYTDTAFVRRHQELGFAPPALWLPHAVNPHAPQPAAVPVRDPRLLFIGDPTPGRRAVIEALDPPPALYGRRWRGAAGARGDVKGAAVRRLYARHLGALNIRNEHNVLDGLNQRNFNPYLTATPVLTDAQGDLALCFEPGREVLVWRDADELNALHARLRRFPAEAAAVGEAGRRRVLAEHVYGRRLAALMAALS